MYSGRWCNMDVAVKQGGVRDSEAGVDCCRYKCYSTIGPVLGFAVLIANPVPLFRRTDCHLQPEQWSTQRPAGGV